jgi:hypothetical protein
MHAAQSSNSKIQLKKISFASWMIQNTQDSWYVPAMLGLFFETKQQKNSNKLNLKLE